MTSQMVRTNELCVCHGFYYDWIEKLPPPGDINSERITLGALSHSLLTFPPPNHGVCPSTRI
jgi:hypothetical protein